MARQASPPARPTAVVSLYARRLAVPRRTTWTYGCTSEADRSEAEHGSLFDALHHATPDLDGPGRADWFYALAPELQALAWESLRRQVERGREAA